MNRAPAAVPLACTGAYREQLTRLVQAGQPVLLTGLDGLEPAEAASLLAYFLHDPEVAQPIEPFATLLAARLERRQLSLWQLHPQAPRDAFLGALPVAHPACLACAGFPVCQGYGAWAGSCATWRTLVDGLASAAAELGRLRPHRAARPVRENPHVQP